MACQIRLQGLGATTPGIELKVFFVVALFKTLGVFRFLQREVAILFHRIHPELGGAATGKVSQPLAIDSGDTLVIERMVDDRSKTIFMQ